MIRINISFVRQMSVGLIIATIIALGSSIVAYAMDPGYFTGGTYSSATGKGWTVLPQDSSGNAIPQSGPGIVNSKASLISFLQKDGDEWTDSGKAFIVCTMLGETYSTCKAKGYIGTVGAGTPAENNRAILYAGWSELESRLNDNDNLVIHWNEMTTSSSNSLYDGKSGGTHDNHLYGQAKTGEAIVFFGKDGTIYYRLFIGCANPSGEIGLPKITATNWRVTPTAVVSLITDSAGVDTGSRTSAKPGYKITWTHTVTNDGPNDTDANVTYHYQNRQDLGGTQGSPDYTLASGTSKGDNKSFPSTYTVPAGYVGKNLCRATSAKPKAKGDNTWIESSPPACVTITDGGDPGGGGGDPQPDTIEYCRPILVSVNPVTYNIPANPALNIPASSVTVPKKVTIDGVLYGTYSSSTTLNISSKYTTGDEHNITIVETTKHITRYVDKTVYEYGQDVDGNWVVVGSHQELDYITYAGPNTSLPVTNFGPCFNYALTLPIFGLNRTKVEAGEVVAFSTEVENRQKKVDAYPHTKSKKTKWQISRIILPPPSVYPNITSPVESSADPCSYYTLPGQCTNLSSGTFDVIGMEDAIVRNTSDTIGDLEVGTKVCYAYSVMASSSDPSHSSFTPDNIWEHSAFTKSNCVIVAKKPKVQIWGGDLLVGGVTGVVRNGVSASTSVKNNIAYGSWAEYGIVAGGDIKGMASGSGYAGGMSALSGVDDATFCKVSTLSFANAVSTTCTGAIGNYSNNTIIGSFDRVKDSFPASAKVFAGGSLSGLVNDAYKASGTISISASSIEKGKWVVINAPDSTVTITGDIKYTTEALKSINDIPQVVIIAKNINIDDNVTNIDAWLVSGGNINTCSSATIGDPKLAVDKCNLKLIVNGPVIANKLYLYRTFGSGVGATSGEPAEIFNLRADAYLWTFARATSRGRIQTVYVTELPPRL